MKELFEMDGEERTMKEGIRKGQVSVTIYAKFSRSLVVFGGAYGMRMRLDRMMKQVTYNAYCTLEDTP